MKIKNAQFFITIRKFLKIYLVKNRCCSENTIKSYTDSLNLYFAYFLDSRKHDDAIVEKNAVNAENSLF